MNAQLRKFPLNLRLFEEHDFESHDGTRLFYRRWKLPAGRARGAVILLHRGHEHGGRMAHLVDEGVFEGFDVYAWDARGHGQSQGPRGAAPDFGTLVRDLDDFVAHIGAAHGVDCRNIALVGQSVGAVVAAAWVHDYAPPIRGMVLAAPAFEVNLFVPFARRALGLWHAVRGDFTVTSYVRPAMLTRDKARARTYSGDPLVTRSISARVLLDLYRVADRIVADAGAITVPTQILMPGADMVVRSGPQRRFFQALGAGRKELQEFPGMRHDILGEEDREQVNAAIHRFLADSFDKPVAVQSLTDQDKAGRTRVEFDRLAAPASPLARLKWGIARSAIRVGSHLSDGLKLGCASGFDSGAMLDYVYRNKASGAGPVGRLVDRIYLNSIGWRGIRARKRHLEDTIQTALKMLDNAGRPLRIVDIAAGHGRYLLEAVSQAATRPGQILLRDMCPNNVASAATLIETRGLSDIARSEQGDAFDAGALAALDPKPTLAVVSGLYELFPDNDPVAASLDGLARAVPTGGLLIYTGQPWHPQLEMIARTLTSFRGGQPWVMRRRTQAELDALVARAGFRKITQRIDRWGIFTVSLAVRVA